MDSLDNLKSRLDNLKTDKGNIVVNIDPESSDDSEDDFDLYLPIPPTDKPKVFIL